LSWGSGPNHCGKNGRTPLHHAAKYGHEDDVQLLLTHGAAVDITDVRGQNSLHHAAGSRSKPTVKLLLDVGADPYAADKSGLTPINVA
ncbi:ankyrin 3, node of Ranvier, partial [Trichodelitschia bisporula]